ncbi:class I SAM-dependent methyltransferase [Cyclobacterium qasimii]|uniref:Class I SAM-dependent methyltransferase n=2 Tax=Cyclobacterium qasimii TaxID=1350429 RepID=S7VCN2_9BACT|nr:class I SAM-dependent methyltransferase [Cyclobacterium qasimii]EPR67711.1 hypothetical protein ADICYQ_3351 [Cyclobacterium qasimii M12-11B]GEO19530.1 hypothetical protein CQA01_00640 [Cyclobacterium qasimii]
MKKALYKFIHQKVSKVQSNIDATIPKLNLEEKHIVNLKVLINREKLLEKLPKNGVIAEIGVNKGEFSQEILRLSKPQKFHLVDAWDSVRYHDGLRNHVESLFKSEIKAEIIEIHQGYSIEKASNFKNGYFDWIYIDTDHSYQVTKSELQAYKDKIKPDGIISGHDYSQGNWGKILRYGVMEAVHEFCIQEDWELIYFTIEMSNNPSFAIRKIQN